MGILAAQHISFEDNLFGELEFVCFWFEVWCSVDLENFYEGALMQLLGAAGFLTFAFEDNTSLFRRSTLSAGVASPEMGTQAFRTCCKENPAKTR